MRFHRQMFQQINKFAIVFYSKVVAINENTQIDSMLLLLVATILKSFYVISNRLRKIIYLVLRDKVVKILGFIICAEGQKL